MEGQAAPSAPIGEHFQLTEVVVVLNLAFAEAVLHSFSLLWLCLYHEIRA